MLHIVESRKPLDRVAKDLEDTVARHHFGAAQEVEATLEAIMAEAARQRIGSSSEFHAIPRR